MWYLSRPLEEWNEQDLLKLVGDKLPESRYLEYKSQLPGNATKDKVRFLASISAFANADGGLLVFGVEEDAGLPVDLPGVEVEDPDQTRLGLEERIRHGLDPTILDVHVGPVRLASGRYAFLCRVPKSLSAPHMVILEDHGKFYMRHSGEKQPMDVTELRQSFLQGEHRIQQLRAFRGERLTLVRANEGPVPLIGAAKVCLHILPVASRDVFVSRDMKEVRDAREFQEHFQTLNNHQTRNVHTCVNFDGLLRYGVTQESWVPEHLKANSRFPVGYVQLFRDGAIEAVDSLLLERWRAYPTPELERMLLSALPHYLKVQEFLGNEPPFFLAVSLLNVRGFEMYNHQPSSPSQSLWEELPNSPLRENELRLPEVAVLDGAGDETEILRSTLYMIWNAFGATRCLLYDSAGAWPK